MSACQNCHGKGKVYCGADFDEVVERCPACAGLGDVADEADIVALRARLAAAEARAAEVEQAARALVEALPKCYERVCEDGAMRDCDKPATRAFRRGEGRWCDEHGLRWIVGHKEPTLAPEYPRAVPLRALVALLGKAGA